MVVLAASITTASGKPLLSRQYKDLTKDRILELLSNFQALLADISSNHTFVEDEHVRYVYKPFDDYYIILITNRQSNIIQDSSTLNLFSQTVNSYLSDFSEQEIFENAFEILSSFDEIICMGYKENLTFSQVNTYLTMESHEERIQEIIERNKEIEATEERKRRAKEIARREQERKRGVLSVEDIGINPNRPSGGMGVGSRLVGSNDPNLANAYNSYYSHASPAAQQSYAKQQEQQRHQHMSVGGTYGEEKLESGAGSHFQERPFRTGMKLSRAGTGTGAGAGAAGRVERGRVSSVSTAAAGMSRHTAHGSSHYPGEEEEPKPENNGILIQVNETVSAQISRDGAIQSSELKGVLELRVNDADLARASIHLSDDLNVKDRSFQFKTHPNIDKNMFLKDRVLALREKTKAFPHNDQTLGVLRWRKLGGIDDNSFVPLMLSTWVTPGSGSTSTFDVTVEFELNQVYADSSEVVLNDLTFTIPVPTDAVKINDDGNDFNARILDINDEVGIIIRLDTPLEANQSGSFSFTINAEMEDALFPINTSFKVRDFAISGVAIKDVVQAEDSSESLPFDVIRSLKTSEYVIV